MRKTLLLLPLLAACATTATGQGDGIKRFGANYKLPAPNSGDLTEVEAAKLKDATRHGLLGETAKESGNIDQARAEWRAAGQGLAEMGDTYTTSEYRLVYWGHAARYLNQGGDFEAATRTAEKIYVDPGADADSRAFAAHMRFAALTQITSAEVRAGRLEPISLAGADKRKGQALHPRPPAEPWRRLVEAADAYGATYKAEGDPHAPENAAAAALKAGQIHYSYDNIEEAAKRFQGVIEGFPGTAAYDDAVRFHLQTFLVRGDTAGYLAAIERVTPSVAAVAKKAADAAKGGDAAAKARAEELAKLAAELQQQKQGSGYATADRLLAEGKAPEAAAAFDKFVAENPTHPDAPFALYNAAVAWSRAKEPKKARADREQLLASYPDARVAPKAALALATDLSVAGDHAGAARRYAQYLERFPAGEDRCLALQNLGAELDAAKQPQEAAGHYVTYASDPRCTKDDPNNAARMLYRAAAIFNKAGKRAETQQALRALVGLSGVTDPVAKSYVDDARSRVK